MSNNLDSAVLARRAVGASRLISEFNQQQQQLSEDQRASILKAYKMKSQLLKSLPTGDESPKIISTAPAPQIGSTPKFNHCPGARIGGPNPPARRDKAVRHELSSYF